MEVQEKNHSRGKKKLYLLFAASLLSGLFCAILFQLGLFIIPVTAAALASLFLAESRGRRILSYIAPCILLVFDLVFNSVYSFNCLASVVLALIIYLCFVKGRAKSECAVYATVLISVFTVISFILSAFFITESFSLDVAASFYSEQFENIKNEFLTIFRELSAEGSESTELFSEEDISLMFTSIYNSITSYIAVFAFTVSGIALKLFSAMSKSLSEFKAARAEWRFKTSALFAYFYYALVIFSFFISEANVFGITVTNLYTVFMFVYAYVGYKYATSLLSANLSRPFLAKVLVWIAIVFFSAFAIQLLSFIGAFITVVSNRRNNLPGTDGDID